MVVSLTPWSLGQHTVLSLPRQLPTAAGKTQRRDVAAGTRNVRVMAGTRDPQGRQGGQEGMLNCHTPSALSDQPKPSEVPAVQPGSFRERCRGDSDCPDAQKCCNSSCGQQCPPGVPAGEAGQDSMGQHGTGWDSMGGEGGDTAQRPGMTPGAAATMAQSCGTSGTPHPMLARVGSARSGVRTHCTAPRWALEWGGEGTVRPASGEATIVLSSCSTVQRTPALPQ